MSDPWPAPQPRSTAPARRLRRDPLAVIIGTVALLVGAAMLWNGFVAPLSAATLKIAVPLGLVVIGALGLILSRR